MGRPVRVRLLRVMLICLVLSAAVNVVTADDEAEAAPTPTEEAETPTEAKEEAPLDCKTDELLEAVDTWSIDCVQMWVQNLGHGELKAPFKEAGMTGMLLKELTMERLADAFGVSEEGDRKKIYYNLLDVMKKDNYHGNVNNWSQFFMWILPVLAIGKCCAMRHEKELARLQKRYKKWQEKRNPPPPVEVKVYEDGTNEWVHGLNSDVATKAPKEKKKPPEKAKKAKKIS